MQKTALYQFHLAHGASMVPFAGYEMPIHYAGGARQARPQTTPQLARILKSYARGVKQEHLHTRAQAGLFDISHMGQVKLTGQDRAALLEALTPSRFSDLAAGRQRYTVLTNPAGGIIDDMMVTETGDHFFIVLNAACKQGDIEYIKSRLRGDSALEILDQHGLLALQGPAAARVMRAFCPEATALGFMSGAAFKVNGVDCFINRCGYSGEDGFELSAPARRIEDIARALLAAEEVALVGLGARDSLRLEAGYCLYGYDLDLHTSPIEADIGWVVARERLASKTADYPGLATIRAHHDNGAKRRRVGLISAGKAPIRRGVTVLNQAHETVGATTSGGFSPTLGQPVAMAYIDQKYAAVDTDLCVKIREREQAVRVCRLPFVPHRYYRRPRA